MIKFSDLFSWLWVGYAFYGVYAAHFEPLADAPIQPPAPWDPWWWYALYLIVVVYLLIGIYSTHFKDD